MMNVPFLPLLGLRVDRVLSAEGAVLFHLQSVWVIFFIFDCIIVSLLALVTSQRDFNAHNLAAPPYLVNAGMKA